MVNKMVLNEHIADEPLRFVLTSNDPKEVSVLTYLQKLPVTYLQCLHN
jgi:hypothetical protein